MPHLILGFWWIPWWGLGDNENDLLHDINTYRKVQNLPILEENYEASCLAIKFAYDLKDKHCEGFHDFHSLPSRNPNIPNFQKSVWKCDFIINTTKDWVLMPVCVPELREDDLFSNYTRNSHFTLEMSHNYLKFLSYLLLFLALKQNKLKAKFTFGGVSMSVHDTIITKFNLIKDDLPFRYLGVHLSSKKLFVMWCQPLVKKIISRIEN